MFICSVAVNKASLEVESLGLCNIDSAEIEVEL